MFLRQRHDQIGNMGALWYLLLSNPSLFISFRSSVGAWCGREKKLSVRITERLLRQNMEDPYHNAIIAGFVCVLILIAWVD